MQTQAGDDWAGLGVSWIGVFLCQMHSRRDALLDSPCTWHPCLGGVPAFTNGLAMDEGTE